MGNPKIGPLITHLREKQNHLDNKTKIQEQLEHTTTSKNIKIHIILPPISCFSRTKRRSETLFIIHDPSINSLCLLSTTHQLLHLSLTFQTMKTFE